MMTPENFCYWLQGFFELQEQSKLTLGQVEMIREHLGLVFEKVTKPAGKPARSQKPRACASPEGFRKLTAKQRSNLKNIFKSTPQEFKNAMSGQRDIHYCSATSLKC